MAFGVVTYFLRKQGNGKKNRPVALDPQKKIPFKLVDKKVSAYKLPERGIRTHFFFYYFLGILCQGEVSAETEGSLSLTWFKIHECGYEPLHGFGLNFNLCSVCSLLIHWNSFHIEDTFSQPKICNRPGISLTRL